MRRRRQSGLGRSAVAAKAYTNTLWRAGEPSDPTNKVLSPAEMTERLFYMERLLANPSVENLPVAELQRKLEQTWVPNPQTLLAAGTVTPDLEATVPHVVVTRPGVQSIANTTFTSAEDIVWTAALQENTAMWTSGASVRAPMGGVYAITTNCFFAAGGTPGSRLVAIILNGGEIARFDIENATTDQPSVARTWRLRANDLITTRIFQSSGGALNVSNTVMSMTWVGGA
jgi:hypothetical protein